MEKLAKDQESVGKELQQIIKNYKRDSKDRKTRSYYEERLRRLESSWSVFEATDNQIRSLPDVPLEHQYFHSDYYAEIANLYKSYRDHFITELASLEQPDDTTGKAPLLMDKVVPSKPDAKKHEDLSLSTKEAAPGNQPSPQVVSDIHRIMRRQRGIMQSLCHLMDNIKHAVEMPEHYYKIKLQTINQYWDQIEDQNHNIWELTDDPISVGYDADEYIRIGEEVQEHKIKLSAKLSSFDAAVTTTLPTTSGISTLQLPKITLPKYDGDYLKWRQFADLFKEMIHKQPMANVQKMWYLKANVVGEAEKLIRHLTLSEDNYLAAWRMLQERYENHRLLVAALVNKLLSQPSQAAENASVSNIKNLHDTTRECLMGLENLNITTSNWDPLLLNILIKKLDRSTHALYEQSLENPREVQTIEKFLQFLQTRFQSLEALGNKLKHTEDHHRRPNPVKSLSSVVYTKSSSKTSACVSCKGNHPLFVCESFLKLTVIERLNLLRKYNLCINCMRPGHIATNCSLRGCTKCNKRHNTLVHISAQEKSDKISSTAPTTASSSKMHNTVSTSTRLLEEVPTVATLTNKRQQKYVLLSTVKVRLTNNQGRNIECRAVLDSGSQVNLITEKLAKQLNLKASNDPLCIQGIGNKTHKTQNRINVLMHSTANAFTARLEAFVLPNIISSQPTQLIDTSTWAIPHNIQLADPSFNRPDHIDLLLGAEFYPQVLSVGQIRLNNEGPILQNTVFGWIVAGKVSIKTTPMATCGICSEDEAISNQIEKFWRLEEPMDDKPNYTREERRCEDHFTQTIKRSSEGRFIVKLPFLDDPKKLGESRDIAARRFASLERRLDKNTELRQQYIDFMDEYLKLGHMEPIDLQDIEPPYYFLPHHSVLKPESSTTKLRVVFDASAKTSSNISLNDILCSGPTIQDDLFSILLRFRMPRFVFTADIQKMYRQVLLDKQDRKYHIILWRNNPNELLRSYQLCTVTYGTTSAPYLAIKCLKKLAQDRGEKYPFGSEVLKNDFYVDDVMTGSDSMAEALEKQVQLINLLDEAGFVIRKWCANHPRLLQRIKPEDQEVQLDFTDQKEEQIKTLGLTWLPKSDQFRIKINVATNRRITKRMVASEIAKIFDPLGIMAPVTVTAKIFLQELWQLRLDWDSALPQELHTRWMRYYDNLTHLKDIRFPRHVFTNENCKEMQFHAFADASERAYGAAVYIRAVNQGGTVTVRLLCAKSRVAPLKKTTIPRLELCAAMLAVQLTNRVKAALRAKETITFFWTDSEIVLSWINSESSTLQTFVAHRVASIQSLSLPQQWRHVGSKENPADVLSRGIPPEKLATCNIWFYGPPFLHGKESVWPAPYVKNGQCDLERKRTTLSVSMNQNAKISEDWINEINHGNSFRKLQRIVAYMLRFVNNSRRLNNQKTSNSVLTTKELDEALYLVIRNMQMEEFKVDIDHLRRHKETSKNSPLSNLTPFLDERGVIRVGGRLEASDLSYDARHQLLLPHSHQFTKLLMNELHKENLHVGPQTLLSITRQRFWPIKGKSIARSVVQHCIQCAKARPKMLSQLMGNLPVTRVQPARPFVNSGVDFCGPITVHYRLRGKRPHKGYIAVFCCFATKAVHFEVVSDLTTDAFIAALKRFIGRRGHCLNLYCDNATNFVGARNQLNELKEIIHSDPAREVISTTCSTKGINFHFIPPRAPHFGGLWEAAVKSAKHLLQRCVASASLTYEELETVIIGIEAILNSRPITSMSNDPNDLTALTPGHFLIGEPLTSTIDARAEPIKLSLHNRWKLVTHLKQEFWRRWSREYLSELQYRLKWKQRCQNVKPGTIVILKEDNLPIMKWPLGRIIKVIHGEDGCVRVADVKTVTGVFRRPINRLSPLPCEQEFAENEPTPSLSDEEDMQEPKKQLKRDPCGNGLQATKRNNDSMTRSAEGHDELPKRKRRSILGSTTTTLLVICLLLPIIMANQIDVTRFECRPGLRFDKLGTMHLVSTDWDLVVYYDLQSYWLEYAALVNGTTAMQHLCQQASHKSTCTELINQVRHIKDELDRDNELLRNNASTTRQRRGALNIVGNVANSLFGVLDNEYAEKMSRTIDEIKQNENQLLSLLKNQTSIVDSTINIMKRDQRATQEKFNSLDNQLNQIINRINSTGKESYQQKIYQLIISLSIQVTLIITSLQRIQSSIIDVLTDIRHGKISPLLLAPHQLTEEIKTIKNHLPSSLRLPAEPTEILHLYQLMSVRGRVVNNHVIFQIKLPLVASEGFELYKILPIPFLANNTLLAIDPHTPYLAINTHRDRYYPLSQQGFSTCVTTMEGESYLCYQQTPIYHRGAHNSKCEISLLNDSPNLNECEIKEVKDDSIWIQTARANQWIYALKGEITINAVCGTEIFTMSLKQSGLLTIQPNCIIKHDSITLQGRQNYQSIVTTSYDKLSHTFNISVSNSKGPMQTEISNYQTQWKELNQLKDQLSSQQLELPNIISAHTSHNMLIAYIGLGSTLVIIVYLTISCILKGQQKDQPAIPTPKPRFRKNLDYSVTV